MALLSIELTRPISMKVIPNNIHHKPSIEFKCQIFLFVYSLSCVGLYKIAKAHYITELIKISFNCVFFPEEK